MSDLFSQGQRFERILMQGAEVWLLREIPLDFSSREILDRLIKETPWRQESITVWGKLHLQPRLIAWFGDPGRSYSYSGIRLQPLPWTKLLSYLRSRVEAVADAKFNSVLLNYYRNGNDHMGFHSDDEPELGLRPIIASLSFGEERTFVFKPKIPRNLKPVRVKLGSSSLLVMKGDTQLNWQHGIPRERVPCGPRVNLTFRRVT